MLINTDVITVIPTFFDNSNNVDIAQILNHIQKQIDANIKTIVILGTTSETPTLSQEEKLLIIEDVFITFEKKLTIIIGVSGFATKAILQEICLYEKYNCHFMISAPYYNKPSQEGLFLHFSTIFSKINKQFILYNVPSRSGVNINPETIAKLYNNFPNKLIAIKEASGSIEQVIKIKSLCNIIILSGDDSLTLSFMAVGAVGVISVVSNIVPNEMLLMVQHFKEGNIDFCQKILYETYDLMKLCFIESNPVPLKFIMNYINHDISANVRLPLTQLEDKNKFAIYKHLAK